MMEADAAATFLQRIVRGYLTRCKLHEARELYNSIVSELEGEEGGQFSIGWFHNNEACWPKSVLMMKPNKSSSNHLTKSSLTKSTSLPTPNHVPTDCMRQSMDDLDCLLNEIDDEISCRGHQSGDATLSKVTPFTSQSLPICGNLTERISLHEMSQSEPSLSTRCPTDITERVIGMASRIPLFKARKEEIKPVPVVRAKCRRTDIWLPPGSPVRCVDGTIYLKPPSFYTHGEFSYQMDNNTKLTKASGKDAVSSPHKHLRDWPRSGITSRKYQCGPGRLSPVTRHSESSSVQTDTPTKEQITQTVTDMAVQTDNESILLKSAEDVGTVPHEGSVKTASALHHGELLSTDSICNNVGDNAALNLSEIGQLQATNQDPYIQEWASQQTDQNGDESEGGTVASLESGQTVDERQGGDACNFISVSKNKLVRQPEQGEGQVTKLLLQEADDASQSEGAMNNIPNPPADITELELTKVSPLPSPVRVQPVDQTFLPAQGDCSSTPLQEPILRHKQNTQYNLQDGRTVSQLQKCQTSESDDPSNLSSIQHSMSNQEETSLWEETFTQSTNPKVLNPADCKQSANQQSPNDSAPVDDKEGSLHSIDIPNDATQEELQSLRDNMSMELLWLEEAISSRKQYLSLVKSMGLKPSLGTQSKVESSN